MFTKIPPFISIPIFYIFVTLGYLYRFFFGNIYGIFVSALILYIYSLPLLGVTPFEASELISWFSLQNESSKAALLASIITVIGFLIAYATATANWKSQLLANLKMEASGDIEVFFSECSQLSTDCKIFAISLIEAVDRIQKGCAPQEADFLASYNRDQGQKFLQQRQRLSTLAIEVHRLQGKYHTLLISSPSLSSGLNSGVQALQKIANKVWIHVPYHIQSDSNPVQSFINQVNVTECSELKNAVNENYGELGFSSGGVRGNLMSPVVGFNLWSLIFLFKEHKGLIKIINERYNKLKK